MQNILEFFNLPDRTPDKNKIATSDFIFALLVLSVRYIRMNQSTVYRPKLIRLADIGIFQGL